MVCYSKSNLKFKHKLPFRFNKLELIKNIKF